MAGKFMTISGLTSLLLTSLPHRLLVENCSTLPATSCNHPMPGASNDSCFRGAEASVATCCINGTAAIQDLSPCPITGTPPGAAMRSGAQRGLQVWCCKTALLAAQLAVVPGEGSPRMAAIMYTVANVSPAPLVSTALGTCSNSSTRPSNTRSSSKERVMEGHVLLAHAVACRALLHHLPAAAATRYASGGCPTLKVL
jgi:hypothetical protein